MKYMGGPLDGQTVDLPAQFRAECLSVPGQVGHYLLSPGDGYRWVPEQAPIIPPGPDAA